MFRRTIIGLATVLSVSSLYAADANQQLEKLWNDEWDYRATQYPSIARMSTGAPQSSLASVSEPVQLQRRAQWAEYIEQLDAIDVAKLSDRNRINHAILRGQLVNRVSSVDTKAYLITMNSDWGFHNGLAGIGKQTTLASVEDANAYLQLLQAVVASLQENTALMQKGLSLGITPPQVVLKGREVAVEPLLVKQAKDSHYFTPFKTRPDNVDDKTWSMLANKGESYIEKSMLPAWRDFYQFFLDDYVPNARTTLAAESMPNGKAFYQGQIREYTTLDLTPAQIHETGLKEVARIKAEMMAIINELQFDGSFAEFVEFLRTDEQFYAKTPRELLMVASYYSKKIDGELPKLFGKMPRLPYAVKPVPAAIAPYYTAGRYSGGSAANHKAGEYWVNTSKLKSRPLYALPALTLHEAVPGHHLQAALTEELDGLPNFRRYSYISAYGEGWALYTERLGTEVDYYETPYDHFGRLTYEMWRACRLVIDTGVHAMGWSREQALDYLGSNTALSMHEVTTEVDRYISWPGQALSYKLGELQIWQIRRDAEARLGDSFQLREFHDAIMALGPVPMNVLTNEMERWIASKE